MQPHSAILLLFIRACSGRRCYARDYFPRKPCWRHSRRRDSRAALRRQYIFEPNECSGRPASYTSLFRHGGAKDLSSKVSPWAYGREVLMLRSHKNAPPVRASISRRYQRATGNRSIGRDMRGPGYGPLLLAARTGLLSNAGFLDGISLDNASSRRRHDCRWAASGLPRLTARAATAPSQATNARVFKP